MALTTWEARPADFDPHTWQLVRDGVPVLDLHRSMVSNGEGETVYPLSQETYEKICKKIANDLLCADLLGRGGTL